LTTAPGLSAGPRARAPFLRRIPYPWLALGAAALAGSLTPLEANLVIVSLPSMARAFDVPASDVIWALVAATLTTVGLALPIAVLSERWGRRNLFRIGFWVFAGGAIIALSAPSLPWLVFARAIQGIGIGMFATVRNAVAVEAIPGHRRGFALGTVLAAVGIGGATAPFLAGWLLSAFGWQAIFATEALLGVAAGVIAFAVMTPEAPEERTARPFDLIGAVMVFVGIAALLVAGNRLPVFGIGSPLVIGLGLGGVTLLALFVRRQLRTQHPLLDLAIFRVRGFAAPTAGLSLQMLSFATAVVLTPFLLEGALGFSPRTASTIFVATAFGLFLGGLPGGMLYDRIGMTRLSIASMVVMVIAFTGLVFVNEDTSVVQIIVALGVIGLMEGAFQSAVAAALVSEVPPDKLAVGSAMFMISIMLPITVGLTIGGTLLTTRLRLHEAAIEAGPAATALAYRDVAIVGLGFAIAALLVMALFRTARPAAT
jgi:MFS family permease